MMKIEITKKQYVTETIDVELPYYYYYDLSGDESGYLIYGKVDFDRTTVIRVTLDWSEPPFLYEIEAELKNPSESSEYFDKKYKSTRDQYELAELEARKFIGWV